MAELRTTSTYSPTGDQPQAIEKLADGILAGEQFQTLVGATGTGKTATMAWTIEKIGRPALIIAHNKTLATTTTSRRENRAAVAECRRRSISSLIEESFSM